MRRSQVCGNLSPGLWKFVICTGSRQQRDKCPNFPWRILALWVLMDVKIQKIYFESIQFFHINSFHTNMYVAIAIGTVSFCKSHIGGNIVVWRSQFCITLPYYIFVCLEGPKMMKSFWGLSPRILEVLKRQSSTESHTDDLLGGWVISDSLSLDQKDYCCYMFYRSSNFGCLTIFLA